MDSINIRRMYQLSTRTRTLRPSSKRYTARIRVLAATRGFGRHPFSRVTDTRNQAGQQGQGHRLFLSPDHPGQADPALASYILRQIRLVAMLMMNLAPRRLLRGAKRQGIIDHQVNDFLLHDLQYQSDKLSRQPQPGPAPFTTHPYQHRAVPKRPFEWRPADCIPDLPWSAGNWRCGNRPRRTFLSGSTPTPSV